MPMVDYQRQYTAIQMCVDTTRKTSHDTNKTWLDYSIVTWSSSMIFISCVAHFTILGQVCSMSHDFVLSLCHWVMSYSHGYIHCQMFLTLSFSGIRSEWPSDRAEMTGPQRYRSGSRSGTSTVTLCRMFCRQLSHRTIGAACPGLGF